jgi:predicted SprT family Zn-dependent metalloprotease
MVTPIATTAKRPAAVFTCKKCGNRLKRVHRVNIIKKYFSWLQIKKYYCVKCAQNFYKWG